MKSSNGRISLTIDNKKYQVPAGITILQAAEMNGIYIPTLCAHKELTPYGGCRMCLVEVEGARRFLTACTTPVEEGMIVRTHTDQIQKERREIMELILSEHTSSCLICDESEGCKKAMPTIRKAGVTTGCRYCPNDDQCELEQVVKYLGIKEIPHPVFYRGLRVEKEDPFYDRDYNLCIYCGRCVRVCQEVRLANVLAFNQRGRNTIIGPAFGRTHVEAGCEFCGSCVSICPTGALAEKYNKWDGVADFTKQTTCAFCGVGCQLDVKVKNQKVIGTAPNEKGIVNQGELCVKGRFCVPEMINHYDRLKSAEILEDSIRLKVTNQEAARKAAEILKNCPPEKFAMIVSPNLSTEDLYAAQKFTRLVMKSPNIDCSARWFYGKNFNGYLKLFRQCGSMDSLKKADVIFAVGLDLQYGRSVIGYFIRRALQKGAKVITLHPHDHSLALTAEVWIQNEPGKELNILNRIYESLDGDEGKKPDSQIIISSRLLKNAKNAIILTGSSFMQQGDGDKILEKILLIAEKIDARVLPLPAQNNLLGSLIAGAYPELLPGAISYANNDIFKKLKDVWGTALPDIDANWNSTAIFSGKKLKVLYLVGETLPVEDDVADYIIYQNIYQMDSKLPQVTFAATSFVESEGSFINGEGRIQKTHAIVPPPENCLPDWEIFSMIAREMGIENFGFKNISEIRSEISLLFEDFSAGLRNNRKLITIPEIELKIKEKPGTVKKQEGGEYILTEMLNEHVYRGIPISSKVDGLKKLIPINSIQINPKDAEEIGLSENQAAKIFINGESKVFPVSFSQKIKERTAQIIYNQNRLNFSNPMRIKLEKADV